EGVITERIPNRKLVFESVAGSMIEQKGIVRFQPNKRRGTRVDVKMSYHPPAGVAGHIIATLFGADPRSEMIEDLMRMKSFIETQHQPHDAAERKAKGG
ncbi:MAG: polyketide cyclase, partial [Acidobacteria bacterium]|nr:polyketide cyclase [Acidobacteriota bacterium]